LKLAEDELFEDFPDGLDDEEQEARDQIYGKEGPKKDEDAEASD
jgi:hypothetical protein